MKSVVYRLSEKTNQAAISGEFTSLFKIHYGRPVSKTLDYMDTFDWLLFHAGYLLYNDGGHFTIIQNLSEAVVNTIPKSAQTSYRFWWDFPAGSFRKKLKRIIDVRALLPTITIIKKTTPINLLNEAEKTVVRLFLNTLEVRRKMNSYHFQTLKVEPLRGYNQAFKKVEHLIGQSDIITGSHHDYAALLAEAGMDPHAYSSKITIQLSPEMPARDAARELLKFLLNVMRQNVDGILEDIDIEFLHDFRVAIRRTRSALSQIKGVFPEEITNQFKTDFACLGKLSNHMRDLDVYLLKKEEYQKLIPQNLHAGLDELFNNLITERKREHKKLVRNLSSQKTLNILNKWESFLYSEEPLADSPHADDPVKQLAAGFIFKKFRKLLKSGKKITPESPDEMLHQLRIDCKKLRYLLEFFTSLFPKEKMVVLIKHLKRLQDYLGEFNDYSVQIKSLQATLNRIPSTTKTFTLYSAALGGLIAGLYVKQEATRSAFSKIFVEFSHSKNVELYHQLFNKTNKKDE